MYWPLMVLWMMLTPQQAFDTQGHRGCRALEPENTLSAMYRAIDLGVKTLEFDLVITKDKQVILSHEPFFNHEISLHPNGNKVNEAEEKQLNIYQMDYAEVKKYDVGLSPHPRFPEQAKKAATKPRLIDLLEALIKYCQQKGKPLPGLNMETKTQAATDGIYHPAPAEFVDLVMAVLQQKKYDAPQMIQSFDPRTLQYLHQQYPGVPTALLVEDDDKRGLKVQLAALGFSPAVYSPHFSLVTPGLVNACHDLGIRIIPWTVNDKPTLERLKALGIDGLISDDPRIFR